MITQTEAIVLNCTLFPVVLFVTYGVQQSKMVHTFDCVGQIQQYDQTWDVPIFCILATQREGVAILLLKFGLATYVLHI